MQKVNCETRPFKFKLLSVHILFNNTPNFTKIKKIVIYATSEYK
jgi:hypothetical protein